jgi:hypothetical protein
MSTRYADSAIGIEQAAYLNRLLAVVVPVIPGYRVEMPYPVPVPDVLSEPPFDDPDLYVRKIGRFKPGECGCDLCPKACIQLCTIGRSLVSLRVDFFESPACYIHVAPIWVAEYLSFTTPLYSNVFSSFFNTARGSLSQQANSLVVGGVIDILHI